MGKNKIILLAAGIIMLIAVGGISAMSVRYRSEQGGTERMTSVVFGGKAKLRNVIELPLSEVEKLTLEYGSKNIRVYPAEDNAAANGIVIEEYLYSDRAGAKASVSWSGEKEAVVTGGKGLSFVLFGFWPGEGERIEVYIPQKSLKMLSLQTGSGNITSETDCIESGGSLAAGAGSGNIRWKNTEAEKISIQAGSGNLHVENLKGRITLHTGSGNITGEKLEGSIDAEAGSGNVRLEEFVGEGKIETSSGNVTVKAESLTGDLAFRAGSGNVNVTIPDDASFHFQAETGSGNIWTDFDQKLSYNKKGNLAQGDVGERPGFHVKAKTNSGNVSVKYR